MKQKLLSILLLCTLLVGTAYAQSRTISGTVTSAEDGTTLPGVSVLVQGGTDGTQTDANGRYTISVPENARTLVFTYLGFTSQNVAIGNNSTVNVSLESDATQLEDVVVVGYGTQLRRNVTTSIASLQASEISDQPVADVASALQGRMAGVQVTSGSGRPGAPISVNIRGRASINAGNDPLYVVDGVILPSNNSVTPATAGSGVSAFANINPEDIQSIEVLKDA